MRVEAAEIKPLYNDTRSMQTGEVTPVKKAPPANEKQVPQEEYLLSPKEMEKTVAQINRTTEAFNISFRFKLHEGSERYIMQVVDIERNEVIKEIPAKKLLDLAAHIKDMIGLLLDEKK